MLSRRLPVGRSERFPVSRRLQIMLGSRLPVGLSRRLPVGQVGGLWLWLCGRLPWMLRLLVLLGAGEGGGDTWELRSIWRC
jgi:hypothetical protein